MNWLSIAVVVIGLSLFEIVSSIDNAIINAEVLRTMSKKARRWFLVWGIIFAVFVVRGMLPWLIVFCTNSQLGVLGSFMATFSSDPAVAESLKKSAPALMGGGGIFLVFLFFHWLFIEDKEFGLKGEKFFLRFGIWFYAVISLVLTILVGMALRESAMVAFGYVIGSTAFFITNGFKENAQRNEESLMHSTISDLSKIIFLEVIDATFSIDGVIGAFAFTMSVPLILIGNGLGALVVRQLTVGNIERIKKYKYLKNGAMYSILVLGSVMIAESFHLEMPFWLSPALTTLIIGFFFLKSLFEIKKRKSEQGEF